MENKKGGAPATPQNGSGKLPQEDRGQVPGTVKNQNLGHNSKKAALGPNTDR